MKKNVGTLDRVIRILFALAMIALYMTGQISGTTGLIFLIVGLILGITGLISLCPIYMMLGLSSKKE
jgi:hypothetical protein